MMVLLYISVVLVMTPLISAMRLRITSWVLLPEAVTISSVLCSLALRRLWVMELWMNIPTQSSEMMMTAHVPPHSRA